MYEPVRTTRVHFNHAFARIWGRLLGVPGKHQRGMIAYRIYHAGILTPPADTAKSEWNARWRTARFYWDFAALRIARQKRLKQLNPELRPLIRELDRHLAARENMQYSMHLYREIRWRMNFTSDVPTTLSGSTICAKAEPARLGGSGCATATRRRQLGPGHRPKCWYLRFYYTVEDGLSGDTVPKYPLHILDRINSPEKLNAQLDSVLHDDFTRTGEFKREELDETASAIMRLLYGHKQTGYTFDPRLKDAMRLFVDKWGIPETGHGDNGWWTGGWPRLEKGRRRNHLPCHQRSSRTGAASRPDRTAGDS